MLNVVFYKGKPWSDIFFPKHLLFEDRGKTPKKKRNTFYFMWGEKGEVYKVKTDSTFFFGLLFGIFT